MAPGLVEAEPGLGVLSAAQILLSRPVEQVKVALLPHLW
jgi:hypothetical protein